VPADLGYRLGRSRGVECWASVEDSVIVLGPPRAGKGLHTVIPMILDAPGAVITTSTRPDNLAATMAARAEVGPVAVFDPQGLATGLPASTRWSPIRGCAVPRVAMARARALCADPAEGVDNRTFWSQQCYTAVRCLLHAAALGHRPPVELLQWSLSPVAALEAVAILTTRPRAAGTWAAALEAILSTDPRQRDSTWAMVSNVFAPLAEPAVLEVVSPDPGRQFDPEEFVRSRSTLYLLGTASGASATANLVTAFVEDIVDAARRLAAASAGARLDPPLAVILDEAANYPLPSLPALMSDGGGSGITTVVVLQSLAQARARWGQQDAQAIWDAAIVKLILGGSANAEDLRDLSALMGTREETRVDTSWGADGRTTRSSSTRETPVLDTARLRTLPFGGAVLLLRSAPPIALTLQPWTARPDAGPLAVARADAEAQLRGRRLNGTG
jgi:type IV secretory pathway TraG/TraD family ATPase VirD4